jgi:hypothetical protein
VLGRTAIPRSTWVSIYYLVLGLSYVAMSLVLISAIWVGSLRRLWEDTPSFLPSFRILALSMVINLVLAGLIYRYEHRGPILRVVGVLIAVGVFLVSAIGAVQTFTLWYRGAFPEPFSDYVFVRPIGAAIYGWLAFAVIRLARASNNRWRGP